jgi:TolB-like protein/Tfp pilus assembly protein PilF
MATERPPQDRFASAKRVFCDAIDRPPSDRAAFLTDACGGDQALRREVESLLARDDQVGSFIERPAAELFAEAGGQHPSAPATPTVSVDPTLLPFSPQLPIGTTLGGYVVEALLGAGGMGEVYRARDVRLRRPVAIKILTGEHAGDRAPAALLREARHASALAHPGICAVHEVGTADGIPFIVMELVDGETLRARVIRCGRLSAREVVSYGVRIADALDHAHGRGLVHRDLKTVNVMIDSGDRVKVLDLGLARWLPDAAGREASAASVSETRVPAGTLEYMAPEVLLGAPADGRSDLWSLGVLLFEMVSGTTPFKGRTPFDTASSVLRAELPWPRGVPLGLRLVIGRCLAVGPADRYQCAADVRAALEALRSARGTRRFIAGAALREISSHARRVAALAATALIMVAGAGAWWLRAPGGTPPPEMRSVAVLPLEDASGDDAGSHFADGVTEALIAEIGKTGVERVISRTTAKKIRESRQPLMDVARGLGVEGIVEGTITRAGDRLRISVRLRDGPTGRELWATKRDRSTRDVLALISDVASDIAGGMHHAISADAGRRLATVRSVAPDVYEAYLQGRYEWNERTEASLQRAIGHYQAAIALDASYAPAYAALADCYNQLGTTYVGTGSPAVYRPRAKATALKALGIDPNLSEAHSTLGYIRLYDWEWQDAEREFVQAIRLNPSNAAAHGYYGNLLAARRRFPEAIREVELARDLDPFSLAMNTNVGWTRWYAGRRDEAIAEYRRVLEMDPTYVQAHMRLGEALGFAGRADEAVAQFRQASRLSGDRPVFRLLIAQVYAAWGRQAEARMLLQGVLGEAGHDYVPPAAVARVYESLGEIDVAFGWLEKAYAERANHVAYLAVEPHAQMRSDPRYAALMHRVGLE